jgi:TetR/AcrR family transcriptional repressor of nem operon
VLASMTTAHDERARTELARSFDRRQDHLTRRLAIMQQRGDPATDADPAALATATMASIEGGLLLTPTRRDPRQLRIALDAALTALRLHP